MDDRTENSEQPAHLKGWRDLEELLTEQNKWLLRYAKNQQKVPFQKQNAETFTKGVDNGIK